MGETAGARARGLLLGQWGGAVQCQWWVTAAGLMLCAAQVGAWLILGLSAADMVNLATADQLDILIKQLAITGGGLMLQILFLAPLQTGRALYFYRIAQGEQTVPVSTITAFFRHGYGKAVRLEIALLFWQTLFGFFCFLPGVFALAGTQWLMPRTPADVQWLVPLMAAVPLLLGLIVWRALLWRFAAARYFLAKEHTARGALRRSRRCMKSNAGTWAWLYLSFAGWWMLCLSVVGCLFALPLVETAKADTVRQLEKAIAPGRHERMVPLGKMAAMKRKPATKRKTAIA
ncbi:MAG: DUF975 family protein [Oscillospiraceae bacterium]|nr:DUF975 family protein [Oscillospiraceae bacterium]